MSKDINNILELRENVKEINTMITNSSIELKNKLIDLTLNNVVNLFSLKEISTKITVLLENHSDLIENQIFEAIEQQSTDFEK